MPPTTYEPEDWDDAHEPEDDFDADLEADDDDSDEDLLWCPECHARVHEETQQCPHCGDWITPVHAPTPGRKALYLAMVVLIVIALLAMVLR